VRIPSNKSNLDKNGHVINPATTLLQLLHNGKLPQPYNTYTEQQNENVIIELADHLRESARTAIFMHYGMLHQVPWLFEDMKATLGVTTASLHDRIEAGIQKLKKLVRVHRKGGIAWESERNKLKASRARKAARHKRSGTS